MDFLLSDVDIMTSDGEVVNILLSEINTQSEETGGEDQSVCQSSYHRCHSITL